MTTKFAIVAMCDPYNAKFHYSGQRVLERDGMTPVKWLAGLDCEVYDSEESAKAALCDFANHLFSSKDDIRYEDEDSLQDLIKETASDLECSLEEIETAWYEGEGWYSCSTNERIFAEGDNRFDDDTMTYMIEELENYGD